MLYYFTILPYQFSYIECDPDYLKHFTKNNLLKEQIRIDGSRTLQSVEMDECLFL